MIWKANTGFSGMVGDLIAIAGIVMFAFTRSSKLNFVIAGITWAFYA